MARKPEIQYVGQFYIYGNAAPKPVEAPVPQPAKPAVPQSKPQKQRELLVDPVALASIVVAAVMLVLMVVSTVRYANAVTAHQQMEQYVIDLQDENARLTHELQTNDAYDLETIRSTALTLGMIPADQAETARITVRIPEPEPEPDMWEQIQWFLQGLFA